MGFQRFPGPPISHELVEAVRSFPVQRELQHCGVGIVVSPFEFYAQCPRCGCCIKLRSFSGVTEIEDVFDAVFEWLEHPLAQEMARRRQAILKDPEQ